MKYIPYLYSLEAELSALDKQSFSKNIVPLINIVKDKKSSKSSKSVLDDLENLIKSKSRNSFFVNIPMNLELTKKRLKNPIAQFYKSIKSDSNYQLSILKRFDKLPNVIPVIDIDISNYVSGDLTKIRSKLNNENVAYIFYAKKSKAILEELSKLITPNDILIYHLDTYDFYKKSIKNEIKEINILKSNINFNTLVIKQIYNDLTFFKLPNGKITTDDPGYDCIDSDFFSEFSTFNFDYFGDHAGIRSTPIYSGGLSYPAFIGLDKNTFSHFGFRGLEKDVNSHSSTLLPNIINSYYWNNILTQNHKNKCYSCSQINNFNTMTILPGKSNPINNATTWKLLVVSHYLSMIDYKLKNNLIY